MWLNENICDTIDTPYVTITTDEPFDYAFNI